VSLERVYWLGGGSGAGKSTIARRLAAEHGLQLYATDDVMHDHAARMDSPRLSEFTAMDMDERWLNRSPQTMLETFHWFEGEGFDLIVEDLRRLSPGVIAEGFRLLPHLVQPLAARGSAVWLLPTPAFREAAFAARPPFPTSDPQRSRRNLLERDRLFTERLGEETRRLGLPAIEVDTTTTEDALAAGVAEAFGL
jgi:2-phosphoglycerate kinase